MRHLSFFFAFVAFTYLQAVPPCTVDPKFKEDKKGHAGCLVKSGPRMVVVRHRFTGKLGLPGGTNEKGETAQCTAHRETWEESGLSVVVGEKLKRFDNGFYLYRCFPIETNLEGKLSLPLPESAKNEITEILLLEPKDFKKKFWRFPEQVAVLKKVFSELHGD